MRMKAPKTPEPERWRVSHAAYGTTDVVAISEDSAILNACREWGASWGLEAAECAAMRIGEAPKQKCRCCGQEIQVAGGGLCNICRQELAERGRRPRAGERKYGA